MLFFMGAASHLTLPVPRNGLAFWVVALAILLVVEINALRAPLARARRSRSRR